MKRHAVLILLLLVTCFGSAGFAEAGEPDPADEAPQIIVWVGGRWSSVSMIENRDGTIIYQKEDATNPVAAKEYSVNIPVTMEVNGALRAFYLTCHGHDVALEEIFELSGESRSLFETIAVRLSRGCYERLKTQYRSAREERRPEPASQEARLHDVARQIELQRESASRVNLTNENLEAVPDQRARSDGSEDGGVSSAEISERCREKWPADEKMQRQCVSTALAAAREFTAGEGPPAGVPEDTWKEIVTWCRGRAPDSARNTTCRSSQVRGFRAIKRRDAASMGVDDLTFSEIRSECRSKSPDDYLKRDQCESAKFGRRALESSRE